MSFVMDVPGRPRPAFVTDAAINVVAQLHTTMDIVCNAANLDSGMRLSRVWASPRPSRREPRVRSPIDAALLATMAGRGQIAGSSVDGP